MNPNTNTDFKKRYGPWAVVTGASSGIGGAIAVELAARGLAVVVAARNQDELERLSTELKQAGDADGRVIAVDLASPDGVRKIEEADA